MIHNQIQKLQQQIMPLLFLLLLLLSHSPLLESAPPPDSCPPDRCRHRHGPTVQFPFRLINHQPPNCSFPGFDLDCNEKGETILQLPVAVNLIVTKIDYELKQIRLSDPEKCLPKKLQSLNLTSSRFNFSDNYIYDFVFFNCSGSEGNGGRNEISCLRGSSYRLYPVESNSNMDMESVTACTRSGNISNVPYSIFGSNDLLLRWYEPACGCGHGRRCVPSNISSTGYDCVDKSRSEVMSKKKRIAGWTAGSLLFVTILTALTFLCITIIKDRMNRKKIEKFLEDYRALKPTRFCYSDIRRITNNFNEKLGEGGFGVVYKAKLSPEIFAAVKVLNNSKENGEEFVNEVSTIGRIHHVNVVRLLGFCAEGFRRVLVYEYLPNESLEKVIFQQETKKNSLGFEKLHEIALGIAKGIEYLHQGCDQQILHFDIKPHNILLDQNYNPKICDFGLAKLCSKEQSAVTMTAARGTMGYIAPELLSRTFGKVSYKSDVYSFGMLLLEMVGGRKNVDNKVENSQVYFPQWIFNHLNLGDEFWAQIEEGEFGNLARKLTIVGLHCIQWYPAERPSMKAVVQMLEGDGSDLSMPSDPFPTNSETNMIGVMNKRHFQIDLPLILENE